MFEAVSLLGCVDPLVRLVFQSFRYSASEGGWDPEGKKRELFSTASRYLVVRDPAGGDAPLAYTHFRFDIDFAIPVLYW